MMMILKITESCTPYQEMSISINDSKIKILKVDIANFILDTGVGKSALFCNRSKEKCRKNNQKSSSD